MAIRSNPERVIPVAPIVGAIVGACAAVAFAIVPTALVERILIASGIASLVSAAAPSLGFTARVLLVVVGGGGLGLIAWLASGLLFGPADAPIAGEGFVLHRSGQDEDDAPLLRRADPQSDAPPRAPLRAHRDLGTGFPDVSSRPAVAMQPAVAEGDRDLSRLLSKRALSDERDEPAAAYDTDALQRDAASDRTHTAPNPSVEDDPAETIYALLDRLERVLQLGAAGQDATASAMSTAPLARPPAGAFEDTLATLRALAQRSR
ncbi:hypothetical protein [Sphingomonas sp. PvP056]|uniref:hypothetical protein n=1 Tax=Sphingomonas sp. PvP056 TaxID=3156392 RepID=UPI0033926E98